MNLDEHAFHQLHVAAERELGVEPANTLMTVLPREPAGELVTKDFFRRELDQRLSLSEANLRLEIAQFRSELKGEIAELRTEMYRLAYRLNVQMWTAMFLVQGLFFTAGQLLA